jgi:hypothetical protein
MKFKKGDKVRSILNGEIFTVRDSFIDLCQYFSTEYIRIEEKSSIYRSDSFELVEENKNMKTYTKEDFKICYNATMGYFITIPMGEYGEDSLYLHKTGILERSCGSENFHKTAEEAGKCLDKYFTEVTVTKKEIAEKFGCREDQLTIV